METSFLEIRCKEVVNVVDGRRLGHIVDIVFNIASGCVLGFVVPGEKSFWNAFKSGKELFIPLNQVVKIGKDTILVELFINCNPNTPFICGNGEKKNNGR